jgi:K+-sensing histidine kinase KdpD
MKAVKAIASLESALRIDEDPQASEAFDRFLRQLVHDLNSPFGTFSLEVPAVRWAAEQIDEAARSGDTKQVLEQAETLTQICDNLDIVMESFQRMLRALEARTQAAREHALPMNEASSL